MLTMQERLRMLEPPDRIVDMVLDTDAYNEIDDQFAIAYALRATEKLRVKALYAAPFLNANSTSPLDGMEKSYDEIKRLLHLAQVDVPVLRGSGGYLPDEKTPVVSDAANDLSRLAMAYTAENPLYVVAIGAITNVASAMLINPAIADRIVVVWLGGHALEWHDNKEFNCQQDVAAARVVYASGAPLVILPCAGVVSAFATTGPELKYWLSGKNALCDFLVKRTCDEANSYAKGKVWSRPIWDVTAIGWLMNADGAFMLEKLIPTPIPEYDHYYSHDPRRPLCKYIYHINRDALFGDLFAHLTKE
jgi:inosine-uridine nucleoside N-ribohydrolase